MTIDLTEPQDPADGLAAVVSGAGPTVLALVVDGADVTAYCPEGWTHHRLHVDADGARVG